MTKGVVYQNLHILFVHHQFHRILVTSERTHRGQPLRSKIMYLYAQEPPQVTVLAPSICTEYDLIATITCRPYALRSAPDPTRPPLPLSLFRKERESSGRTRPPSRPLPSLCATVPPSRCAEPETRLGPLRSAAIRRDLP